jgi:hypothetical protein
MPGNASAKHSIPQRTGPKEAQPHKSDIQDRGISRSDGRQIWPLSQCRVSKSDAEDGQFSAQALTRLFYINILNRYMTGVTYQIPDRLRQIVLTKGTDALEAAVELESATDLRKWAWYSSSWQDYHTALLLLIEVFLFPNAQGVEPHMVLLGFYLCGCYLESPSDGSNRSGAEHS